MRWIRLFESYDKDVKLAKANEIFGIWLMIKIFSKGILKKEEYDDNGTTITNYFTAGVPLQRRPVLRNKVISIKMNSTNGLGSVRSAGGDGIISVSKPYRSRMIRKFLTKCGFKNPDGREYWTWYEQALKKIYALPTNTKVQTLYGSVDMG